MHSPTSTRLVRNEKLGKDMAFATHYFEAFNSLF
jgi:hypothetical protein